jgi:alkylresorcinol/alkylpyrone synthase
MFITGIGTAVPPRRYTQRECWEALQASPHFTGLSIRSRSLVKKVLAAENGIVSRHLAVDPLADAFDLSPDALHRRFSSHAPVLAAAAARQALSQAGLNEREVDALLISTCTGYLCPGLTSYVSERLELRRDAICLDLVGHGCGAAVPNLRAAEALIDSGRVRHALSICVEVCSAAFYLDDDPGVLISACLFGDGAGAAVASARLPPGRRSVRLLRSNTVLRPEQRDELRFEQRGGMLRNILKPTVPKLASGTAAALLDETLSLAGRTRADIRAWIWHAGGRDVLLALQEQMALSESDIRHSAAVLREYGNISSPCILFVLDATLCDTAPGGLWWMSSFGAGFSCHGALLEVS